MPKSTREVVKIRTVKDKQDLKKLKNKRKKWASLGVGDIVVDLAADESCWPKDLGGAFKIRPSTKNILLRTANCGEMCKYGEKEVTFSCGEDWEVIGLKFLETDVKKPLLAVRRLVERGNVVSFGPGPGHNYIKNFEAGKKIPMERRGGSFVLKAHFVTEVADTEEADPGFTRQVR